MERNMLLEQWSVCAVDLYNVFRFPLCILETSQLLTRFFFLTQNLGIEDKSLLNSMGM